MAEPVPYRDLTDKLFPRDPVQKLVPFLGAGASAVRDEPKDLPGFPSEDQLSEVFTALHLTDNGQGTNRLFVVFGLAIAYLMATSAQIDETDSDVLDRLVAAKHPPSVGDLIDLFTERSTSSGIHQTVEKLNKKWPWKKEPLREEQLLSLVKGLSQITGLWSDSLTSIAAFYESQSNRNDLLDMLKKIFLTKTTPTITHELIAEAATTYLERLGNKIPFGEVRNKHYLIVTTNYDGLMEQALGTVPYVVLFSTKDGKTHARFSPSLDPDYLEQMADLHEPGAAKLFKLRATSPLVVIYKIHGSIVEQANNDIVISDFDYEDYIALMATDGLPVPSPVRNLMHRKSFLFLGYGLGDWNIRTILTAVMGQREPGEMGDYAVMQNPSPASHAYGKRRDINVYDTCLEAFAAGIRAARNKRRSSDMSHKATAS